MCVGGREREWAVVLISLPLVYLKLNYFITSALTNSQFFNLQPVISFHRLVTYVICLPRFVLVSVCQHLLALCLRFLDLWVMHYHGNSDIEFAKMMASHWLIPVSVAKGVGADKMLSLDMQAVFIFNLYICNPISSCFIL